ncbi:Glycerol-3-phosphate acyltransferase [Phycisphaerae bacterium RAS1]|nr:Glycerol-3-phosphate acyltransferase [Phycisphaerae bacterium RAS1]
MQNFEVAIVVALAYLIGAVPFGLLIGLSRGVDVRQAGSRNIGATNVGRVLGRKWGLLCLALDVLKGFTPALFASFMFAYERADARAHVSVLLVAVAAVLGHVFPVWLSFRGGKGVATTVGVALGVYPAYSIAMSAALAVYAILRFTTGRVSVGSLAIAVVFPASVYGYVRYRAMPIEHAWPLIAVALLLGLLIIFRHAANIQRLLRGTEPATHAS